MGFIEKKKRILILYSLFIFSTLLSFSANDEQKFQAIANEIENKAFSHGQKANELLQQLDMIAKAHPDNIHFRMQALYLKARINSLQEISDSSLTSRIQVEIASPKMNKYPFEKMLLTSAAAICYTVDGNYTEAFSAALQFLEQSQQQGNVDRSFRVKALNLLGNVCARTQNRKMAIDYYRQALALTKQGEKDYYSSLITLYTNLSYLDEKNEKAAADSLQSLIPVIEQRCDTSQLIILHFNLGTMLIGQGDGETGYDHYLVCKEYAKEYNLDNQIFTFMLHYNIGSIYESKHDYVGALRYAYIAKAAAAKNRNTEQLALVLYLISNVYKQTNRIDSAYFYLTEYNELQLKLNRNSKTIEVYKDYISIYLDSTKKELVIAEQEAALRNKRFTIFILLGIGIILTIGFVLIFVFQKKRDLSKRLKQEQQIQELQKDKIDMQVREITSFSLLLSNKNYIFQQILKLIQQLPVQQQKEEEDVKHKIIEIVKNNQDVDKEQNNFMLHFEKVHPDFFKKLKMHCSDLTENNLLLCAYFRIGLSAKQIAQILNVSFDTIRSNRYRLRKKLGLGEEDNLLDFLRNL